MGRDTRRGPAREGASPPRGRAASLRQTARWAGGPPYLFRLLSLHFLRRSRGDGCRFRCSGPAAWLEGTCGAGERAGAARGAGLDGRCGGGGEGAEQGGAAGVGEAVAGGEEGLRRQASVNRGRVTGPGHGAGSRSGPAAAVRKRREVLGGRGPRATRAAYEGEGRRTEGRQAAVESVQGPGAGEWRTRPGPGPAARPGARGSAVQIKPARAGGGSRPSSQASDRRKDCKLAGRDGAATRRRAGSAGLEEAAGAAQQPRYPQAPIGPEPIARHVELQQARAPLRCRLVAGAARADGAAGAECKAAAGRVDLGWGGCGLVEVGLGEG